MFFKLYNALNIFQIFINNVLREYFNVFYFIYLNDIFIYNDIEKQHIQHVKKILNKL